MPDEDRLSTRIETQRLLAEENRSLDFLATPPPAPREQPVATDASGGSEGTPPADVSD